MRTQLTAHRMSPEVAHATDGVARLEGVFARLDRAITSEQVAKVVVEGGCAAAAANSGALVLLNTERTELRVIHAVGDDPASATRTGTLALSQRFPLCDVVRSRKELWLTDPNVLADAYPGIEASGNACAWAALPLQIDGVILGAVGWSFERQWLTSVQRASMRALTEAAGVALYRAGVFDSERQVRMRAELGAYDIVRQDRMMAAISSTLDSAGDAERGSKSLGLVARLLLQRLGEWSCVQTIDEHGRLRQMATAHADPQKEQLLHQLLPDGITSPRKPLGLLDRGLPVLVENIEMDSTRTGVLGRRHVEALRMLGVQRVLLVPMRIHGQTLGVLSVGTGRGGLTYSQSDQSVADRVARRCAAWLEYVRWRQIAERANQAREDFVAATSHELRTPLSHIKGFVSTLRTNDAAWDATTRDDFLAEIEHEADRLASLVDILLDLSRIDSGGLDPAQRRPVAPVSLVAAGIDRVRTSFPDRRLELHVAPELPAVLADASQVERVVANLLDNAAKYSPQSEPITIEAHIDGRFVVFRIEDRGLGVPPEHAERIFEPFFREPTGAYPAKPGTGLGLAICRSIIRSQRGRIWTEQRPGGGAVMAFTLPMAMTTEKG